MAVGCFAEVVAGMKEAVAPQADVTFCSFLPILSFLFFSFQSIPSFLFLVGSQELFKVFLKGISDDDDEVRNNSAYGVGVLCEVLGPNSVKYYPQVLQKLHGLFVNNAYVNTIDNACGAVSRIIVTNPSSVPLPQVLPALFSALPLKIDYAENKAVFNCIFFLFGTQHEYV